jgi:hypothetical protein
VLGNVKRPYKKRLNPVGWDIWDRTVISGTRIKDGTIVTVTQHNGPFRTITDEHGNVNAVGRGSLVSIKETRS